MTETDDIIISWEAEHICIAYSETYPLIGIGVTEGEARQSLLDCIDCYLELRAEVEEIK